MSEDKEKERVEPEMPNDRHNFWLQIWSLWPNFLLFVFIFTTTFYLVINQAHPPFSEEYFYTHSLFTSALAHLKMEKSLKVACLGLSWIFLFVCVTDDFTPLETTQLDLGKNHHRWY